GPIALAVLLLWPQWWPLVAVTFVLRILSAWIVSKGILDARVPWHLLPAQDLLGFGFWIAGFFGNSIHWRGRRYILNRDGTVEPAA
ncbi:MAG: hypothetical protein JO033_21715, partial [Acidobacteriaceae bacterium]|nr:hypothetical protein [Acidobacteriaceae bacterium]